MEPVDVVVVEDGPVDPLTFAKDVGERAFVTFLFAVLSLLTVTGLTDLDMEFAENLATSGLVAAATALSTMALPKRGFGLGPVEDVIARASWSFVQAATMTIAADAGFDMFDVTAWQTAAVGGLAALFSVVKGFVATRMTGATITPASLASTR